MPKRLVRSVCISRSSHARDALLAPRIARMKDNELHSLLQHGELIESESSTTVLSSTDIT